MNDQLEKVLDLAERLINNARFLNDNKSMIIYESDTFKNHLLSNKNDAVTLERAIGELTNE